MTDTEKDKPILNPYVKIFRPKLSFFDKLVWIFLGQFKLARKFIGGYWVKTHLMQYRPQGVWLCMTHEGFELFKTAPDVMSIEVWN